MFSLLSCVKSFQVTLQMKGSQTLGINISGKNNLHLSVIPAELCRVIWILGQLYKQEALKYPAEKVVIYSFFGHKYMLIIPYFWELGIAPDSNGSEHSWRAWDS